MINEELLQFVWKQKLILNQPLETTKGEKITVFQTGLHNSNAGPDFYDARINIGETLWAGSVEFHIKSSDWYNHKHHQDKAYNNVILHVVLEDDKPIGRPTLILKSHLSPALIDKFNALMASDDTIPCQQMLSNVPPLSISHQRERALVGRLERKSSIIHGLLTDSKNDWDQVLYRVLLKGFGSKINAEAFDILASALPLKIVRKHLHSLHETEALFFGCSGLLTEHPGDAYESELRRSFQHFKNKYRLAPLPAVTWKFSRLRPPNFPTIRLAQVSSLLHKRNLSIEEISEMTFPELKNIFKVQASPFWDSHFTFSKQSKESAAKPLGVATINHLLINAVAPLLFSYGQYKGNEALKESAIGILERLPTEKNSVIAQWKTLGVEAVNAFDSQGLLETRSSYCNLKKCLHCAIGNNILRSEAH